MPDVTVTPSTTSVTVAGATQVLVPSQPYESSTMFSDMVGNAYPFNTVVGTAANQSGGLISFTGAATDSWGICAMAVGTYGGQARAGIHAAPTASGAVTRFYNWGLGNFDISTRCVITQAASTLRTFFGYGVTHGPDDTSVGQRFMLADGAGFVAYGNSGFWELQINYTTLDEDTGERILHESTVVSTASPNDWHNLRLVVTDGPTSVRWYIDEVLVREMTSNFPPIVSSVDPGIEIRDKAAGGTGTLGICSVDWMKVTYTGDRLP